jgi:hypothetical protein
MMGKMQTRMLVATFVVITFVSTPLSSLGQKASPVAPTKAQVEAVVREAYDKFQSNTSGKNADYIPFLAQVDSKMFGVAVVSTDNQVFSSARPTTPSQSSQFPKSTRWPSPWRSSEPIGFLIVSAASRLAELLIR